MMRQRHYKKRAGEEQTAPQRFTVTLPLMALVPITLAGVSHAVDEVEAEAEDALLRRSRARARP